MLDLKFVRENPDIVKKNIENKFQFEKLPLVDEVIELDAKNRAAKAEADNLRASRNKLSKQIGQLMGQGKKDEAEEVKAQVAANAARLAELEAQETELEAKVLKIMMTIPNIIDPSVPIGKDREIRRSVCSGLRDSVSYRYHEDLRRHRLRRSRQGSRKWLLLPDGRYRKTAFRSDFLRA